MNEKMIDIDEKITLECPKGHVYNTTFREFQAGQRCKVCEVIKTLESEGSKLLNENDFMYKEEYDE